MKTLKLFIALITIASISVIIYITTLKALTSSTIVQRTSELKSSSNSVSTSAPISHIHRNTQSKVVSQLQISQANSNSNALANSNTNHLNKSNIVLPHKHSSSSYEYGGRVLYVNNHLKTEIVSAHFDLRQNRRTIALLGCHHRQHAQGVKYYCLVKSSDGTETCLSTETSQELLSQGDENSSKLCWSYRFSCTLDDGELPTSVALATSSTCDGAKSDWVSILDSRFKSYKIGSAPVRELTVGVCYQTPLFRAGELKKEVMVESIERNRAMGVEWLTVYFRENPSSEVMQVLKYYEKRGIVEVINMTISDATFYDVRYYGELLAIRDCIYRNMHRVKYLAMIDFDEVIVPQHSAHKSLVDMLRSLDTTSTGAFQFKHVAMMMPPGDKDHFKQTCHGSNSPIAAPKYLTNTFRTKPFPIKQTVSVGRWKAIVKPQYVDKIAIHSVPGMLSGYSQQSVPVSMGLLYHYRESYFFDVKLCKDCDRDNRFIVLSPDLVDQYVERVCNVLE